MQPLSALIKNKMQSTLLILICIGFLSSLKDSLKVFHLRGIAQGTTYHIIYYAHDSIVTKDEIDNLLNRIDSSLSIYKPYSLISQFNASSTFLEIDSDFQNVVKKSIEVFTETGGAFDITVQPLVQAWGFGVNRPFSFPDSAVIHSILPCIGTQNIHLDGKILKKDKPCVRVDVNGIAQGYSVDVLASLLERKGINNYLIELGGEIRIEGRKPGGQKKAIAIEFPVKNKFAPSTVGQIIYLDHGGITTSGIDRKFYEQGGKKISHLIDPSTGFSIQNELISVTVYANDAITADAYDNALMVFGLKKSFEFLEKHKEIEAYFFYHKPDGSVADTASKGFYKLMKKN
jgi:FAD:protein FMN transferase